MWHYYPNDKRATVCLVCLNAHVTIKNWTLGLTLYVEVVPDRVDAQHCMHSCLYISRYLHRTPASSVCVYRPDSNIQTHKSWAWFWKANWRTTQTVNCCRQFWSTVITICFWKIVGFFSTVIVLCYAIWKYSMSFWPRAKELSFT